MRAGRDGLLAAILDEVAHHGLGDRSLRDLAAAVGTSHRMLLYHFGSRPRLVAAIVAEVEACERVVLTDLAAAADTPADLVRALWAQLTSPEVLPFVALFYEAVAVTSRGPASDLTGPWLSRTDAIAADVGTVVDPDEARLGVAVVRGLLVDVLTTGEVEPATRALDRYLGRMS